MTDILVTTSRMPFALDEIRKFGAAQHRVFATDTFELSPGSHSKYVTEALLTESPRYATAAFVDRVVEIVDSRGIEVLVPQFEEVFYLARFAERFEGATELFAPTFDTLAELHDKMRFLARAEAVGLAVPRTQTVTDRAELAEAMRGLPEFFARPVFSRGGVNLFTNTGPLAGAMKLEECAPTAELPWIVQEFVHGHEVCGFSVVKHGRVAAHSTYIHPRMMEHAGGITYESIVEPQTLSAAASIAEATGYHGQLSLDFVATDRGLVAIECNPRPTAGVLVMPDDMFVGAVLGKKQRPVRVAPAGARHKISVALMRDMVRDWREAPKDIAALFSRSKDVYARRGDLMPALYSLLSYAHVRDYRRDLDLPKDRRRDLMAAQFYDVCWDGTDIPG